MAAPTAKEVKDRIKAITIAGEVATTAYTDEGCTIIPNSLPTLLIAMRGANREQTNRNSLKVTRNYELLLLVEEFDPGSLEGKISAVDAAETLVDVLPDYFHRYAPRLELNKVAMTGVERINMITDNDTRTIEWGGLTYSCVIYTLPVVTQRFI